MTSNSATKQPLSPGASQKPRNARKVPPWAGAVAGAAVRCAALVALLSGLAGAAAAADADSDAAAQEVARRSGLPAADVQRLLADCQASQQSLYFCAWRDTIVAQARLERTLAERQRAAGPCSAAQRDALQRRVKRGTAACERAARQEWGEGSLRDTARLHCEAGVVERAVRAARTVGVCTAASQPR